MNNMVSLAKEVKNRIKQTSAYALVHSLTEHGLPSDPVKQGIIRELGARFGTPVLVETGTYMGNMIQAIKHDFKRIYSIELQTELWERAKQKFANDKHITLLQGDSGEVLATVLAELDQPALFWLDGHYSGDITAKGELVTPIQKELEQIFRHPLAAQHVILIDDARLFVGKDDYPTLETIETTVRANGYDHFEVDKDIIRIWRTRE